VRTIPIAAALLCVLAVSAVEAQETASLAIRVVDPSNAPIAGARLELIGTRFHAVSGDSGWVRLKGLPAGPALLRVTRIGYAPVEATLQLPAGAPFEADVEMTPAPVAVRGVAGTKERRSPGLAITGFYRRREMGNGAFLGPDDIARSQALRLSDLFRRVAGVRVVPAGSTGYILQSVRYGMTLSRGSMGSFRPRGISRGAPASRNLCTMTVYVDGAPTVLESIDDVSLQTVGAVEVYRGPAEIPPMYNASGSACGVVLLWSRTADANPDPNAAP
jgi:carboxypeptidase family protein/TonB-dependent receptor-like protein